MTYSLLYNKSKLEGGVVDETLLEKECSMSDRVGQQLGNYRLMRLLGQGGFADVYLGEHIYLKTPAAIKVLQTRLVQDDLQVFLKEARSIANLIHPHIVRVLEFGVEGDLPFLVMDHAANGTLRQRHPKGTRVPPPVIAAYIKQVASALQYAHEQRLVHRDIKPENMLLGRNNEVLLSDFGIAVVAQSSRYQQSSQDVGGTIAYMAPEQLQGRAVPASDQYALGIVVYEWLCGERPFQGSFPEIASQHMLAIPTPLRSKVPGLSPAIEEVVQRSLAKDPQQRFMNVQAFAQALEQAAQSGQYAQSQPTYVPPPPPMMGAAQPGTPSGSYGSIPSGPPSSNFGTTQPQQGTPSGTYGANSFGQTTPNGNPSRSETPSGMYGNIPPAQTTPSGNFGAVPPGQTTPNFGSMQQGTPTGNFTNYPGQSAPNYPAFPSGPQAPNPHSSMLPGQFAQMAPGNNQPKKMMSRRTAILGIAGLVVIIGGGTALALSQKHDNGPGTVASGTTPTGNTPITAPTDTPTSLPTDTPTTDPNVTPTPTTVPTVQTTPGAVLYTADWSSGMNGWAGSADWKVLNGALLNDGSNGNSANGPTIVPPYQLEGINDYAIEAKVQVVSYQNNYPVFGFAIRGTTVNNSWQGYQNALGYLDAASNNSTCNTRIYTNDMNNPLVNAPFDPAKSVHTYRFEAKGNTLKFYIDGGSVLQVVDNQFLGGAQVGLWCYHVELSVTSFKITAL